MECLMPKDFRDYEQSQSGLSLNAAWEIWSNTAQYGSLFPTYPVQSEKMGMVAAHTREKYNSSKLH